MCKTHTSWSDDCATHTTDRCVITRSCVKTSLVYFFAFLLLILSLSLSLLRLRLHLFLLVVVVFVLLFVICSFISCNCVSMLLFFCESSIIYTEMRIDLAWFSFNGIIFLSGYSICSLPAAATTTDPRCVRVFCVIQWRKMLNRTSMSTVMTLEMR